MNNLDEKHLELINLWCKFWNERKPEELVKIFNDNFIYEDVATSTINKSKDE